EAYQAMPLGEFQDYRNSFGRHFRSYRHQHMHAGAIVRARPWGVVHVFVRQHFIFWVATAQFVIEGVHVGFFAERHTVLIQQILIETHGLAARDGSPAVPDRQPDVAGAVLTGTDRAG